MKRSSEWSSRGLMYVCYSYNVEIWSSFKNRFGGLLRKRNDQELKFGCVGRVSGKICVAG
ncbi:hypothetical protein ACHAXM_006849 [Skeletonema potamos]